MTVGNLSNGVIHTDGSVTVTVTVVPENLKEACFLGFCVATVNTPNANVSVISTEANALAIPIPAF